MDNTVIDATSVEKEWKMLLEPFSSHAAQYKSGDLLNFQGLLSKFVKAEQNACTTARPKITEESRECESLLSGYHDAVLQWRELQNGLAEDFNLIELFGLVSDENRHSNVLAWLLSCDIYDATHSQQNLGFRVFAEELGLSSEYPVGTYFVGREVQGEESRIDIEVYSKNRFIIHIEAKIDSIEGIKQLEREWRDLQRHAISDRCGVTDSAHIHAYFLTRGGEAPSHPNFKPISWGTIANVFEKFSESAKAESVSWFTQHYAHALRKYITSSDNRGHTNDNKTVRRSRVVSGEELDGGMPT
jgi:hypothetical protein